MRRNRKPEFGQQQGSHCAAGLVLKCPHHHHHLGSLWTSCDTSAASGGRPGASQDVQRTPNVCCEDIFNDENAQRPPQFNERPRKLEKTEQKEGRERDKKKKFWMVRSRGVQGRDAQGRDARGRSVRGKGGPGLGCQRQGDTTHNTTPHNTTQHHTTAIQNHPPTHPTHPPNQPTNQHNHTTIKLRGF